MFRYKLTDEDIAYVDSHASLMCAGFSTYSFKNNCKQSKDVYKIGKAGELVVQKYLESVDSEIVHSPFRSDYSRMNFKDDFQVKVKEKICQIEVRTKCRNVEPKPDYECCTDCIKPGLTYIFVSLNRKTMEGVVLGWADWKCFAKYAEETVKGTENNNFVNKTTEFNIKIKHLYNL